MEKWKPGNRGGRFYHDPQAELRFWIYRAGDFPMVAVPVELLVACERRRECDATTIATGDEDGPMPPMTIYCRLNSDHKDLGVKSHFNGYYHWED
jgi:hypothetical protein